MIADTTLYDLRTKTVVREESPSGRLLLDDEPLEVGEGIDIASTRGRWLRVTVRRDVHGWYGEYRRPGERVRFFALIPQLRARRA